jgi:hypothetical protein
MRCDHRKMLSKESKMSQPHTVQKKTPTAGPPWCPGRRCDDLAAPAMRNVDM